MKLLSSGTNLDRQVLGAGRRPGTSQGLLGKDQGGQDTLQGGLPRVLSAVKAHLLAVSKEFDIEDQIVPAMKQGTLGQEQGGQVEDHEGLPRDLAADGIECETDV